MTIPLPGGLALLVALVAAGGGDPGPDVAASQSAAPQDTAGYSCITCHADKRRAFLQGVHSQRGIRCADCHGGNPKAFEVNTAHAGRFVGVPSKVGIAQLCGSCHSDPNRMRQYGLPAGQLAELWTSRHGQLLRRGNTDVPTCTDCHDAHTILPPLDARSTVYPTNIPATCAKCHSNADLMKKYGLPANELALYQTGAHGVALFEKKNFAAPTCIGCHGSHAALPPAVTEIVHVCERCHAQLGQALENGPHGPAAAAGKLPGCLGCHSNHATERVPPEQIAATCTKCHAASSAAANVGVEIQQQVVQATDNMREAANALAQLVSQGRSITDESFRYQEALTAYQQIAEIQHSLDLDRLGDLGRQVSSMTRTINATAEVSSERRWEHKLLLIPIWFFALAGFIIAGFKLAELRRSGRG